MLVVRILHRPYGDASREEVIGEAVIVNDGRSRLRPALGDYDFGLSHDDEKLWRVGRVTGFPRLKLTAWDLLYRVLRAAVGDRNGDADA